MMDLVSRVVVRAGAVAMMAMLSLLAPKACHAELVHYTFTGVLTEASSINAILPDDVVIGANFHGTLTFEDLTPGMSSGPGGRIYFGAIVGMSVTVGTSTFTSSQVEAAYPQVQQYVHLIDNRASGPLVYDEFTASVSSADPQYVTSSGMKLMLQDFASQPTGLTTTLLTEARPSLADFQTRSFSWSDSSYDSALDQYDYLRSFRGSLTSFRLTPVPEPASLAMLAVGGLGVLGGIRRRRRAATA